MTRTAGAASRRIPRREPLLTRDARPFTVAGTASVALLLAGTRWASYIGVNPVFLTDVLLLLAVYLIVTRAIRRPDQVVLRPGRPGSPLPLLAVLAFVLLRLVMGGDLSLVALRDAFPYLYTAAGLLAFYAVRRTGEDSKRNTFRVFVAALIFHAVWFVAQEAVPSLPYLLPTLNATQGVHLFTPRPDVDTTLVGVLGALILWRMLHGGRHPVLLAIAYAGTFAAVAASFTRAGLLGAVVASAYVVLATLLERGRSPHRKLLIVAVVPIVLISGVVAVSFTGVGAKLIATVAPSAISGNAVADGAEGTTRARSNAWDRLVQWTFADQQRTVIGVGYGPDFLAESGASVLLVGDAINDDVRPRSPHDYWLGTMARMGLIGLALVIAAVVQFLVRTWRIRRSATLDPATLLLILVPLSLIVPASLGVVLESPFAAVPFWWCLGAVLGTAIPAGAISGRANRARLSGSAARSAARR